MLLNSFARVVALSALGFFISCSTPRESQTIADYVNKKQFAQAVKLSEQVILKNPTKADAYFFHAYALNEQARITEYTYDRYPLYVKFMNSFRRANQIWKVEQKFGKLDELYALRYQSWAREYNAAVQIADGNRSGEIEDWLSVYEATENAQVLIPDSTIVVPVQLESLIEMDDWIGVDSVITIYQKKFANAKWLESGQLQLALKRNDVTEINRILTKSKNWRDPNSFLAVVMSQRQSVDELLVSIAAYIDQGKPSREFYLLVSSAYWKGILENTFVNEQLLKKMYRQLFLKDEQFKTDSTDVLKKAAIIDKSLSMIPIESADRDLTQFKAILFTNIASFMIEHERSNPGFNVEENEAIIYYLKKAAPEWQLLIYQYRQEPEESAKNLIKIYEWLGENDLIADLKEEFSL